MARNLKALLRAMGMQALLAASMAHAAPLPDPTRPARVIRPVIATLPTAPAPIAPTWKLESLLVTPQIKFAVINGQRVRLGEFIAGAVVTRIEPTFVLLRRENREFTVRLWPAEMMYKP